MQEFRCYEAKIQENEKAGEIFWSNRVNRHLMDDSHICICICIYIYIYEKTAIYDNADTSLALNALVCVPQIHMHSN